MFLTPTEVVQLTGREFKRLQVEWLRAHGILHYVSAKGDVNVPRSAIEGRPASELPQVKWEPNFTNTAGAA